MSEILDILYRKSEYVTESGCLIWLASVNNKGYGKLAIQQRLTLAHRAMWEETHGAVPEGSLVLHRCDVPCCINPHHLFLGTMKDNVRDMLNKCRGLVGERNGNAKITDEQAIAIRNDPRKQVVIAREFGIHKCIVNNVKRRYTFKHLP